MENHAPARTQEPRGRVRRVMGWWLDSAWTGDLNKRREDKQTVDSEETVLEGDEEREKERERDKTRERERERRGQNGRRPLQAPFSIQSITEYNQGPCRVVGAWI